MFYSQYPFLPLGPRKHQMTKFSRGSEPTHRKSTDWGRGGNKGQRNRLLHLVAIVCTLKQTGLASADFQLGMTNKFW